MNILKGNILNITKGVICHQVNNKHVMGAGLALEIRKRYPQHYQDYMNTDMILGNLVTTAVSESFGIVGLIAQDGYGRNKNIVYTKKEAFKRCLQKIKQMHDYAPDVKWYMPYNIGCGLANGDWNEISQLIEEITPFIIIIEKK